MKLNLKVEMKKIFTLFCFITLLVIPGQKVHAATGTDAKMLDNGDFYFKTTDTVATTNITWESIGFTVRRDTSNGNPLKDDNYAIFWLRSGQKIEFTNTNGTKTVTFYLTKKQVNEALANTDLGTIKDNDTLYINGIIQVHNGTKAQDTYYTKTGIENAENWANPDDFADRFDIKITYEAGEQTYPVTIEYQLYQSGSYTTIATKNCGSHQNHDDFTTTSGNIPDSQVSNGETYYLYRVYYQNLSSTKKLGNRKTAVDKNLYPDEYKDDLRYIRDRTFTVQGAEEEDGLNIVAIYRRYPVKEDSENAEEITKEYEETDPTAVIGADARGNEAYEVTGGIPGIESLYANAFTGEYLAGSIFTRVYGTRYYTVNVEKTYNLKWTTTTTETDPVTGETTTVTENHSETKDMTYTYKIARDYSYWVITSLGVYGIENAVLYNAALPKGSVTLTPFGYSSPTVSYTHGEEESDHLIQPKNEITVDLGSETVNSSSVPSREYRIEAEGSVAKIQCMNDSLIFNGETVMSAEVKEEKTDAPDEIPSGLEETGENVLYQSNLVIPGTLANGEYETTGTVTYKPIAELNPSEVETAYGLEDVNSVVVHTPTVCDAKIQDKYEDNQMIAPDTSVASLVLDTGFYVKLPTTGTHRYIKGYNYNDYGSYVESREAKFPFDVYRGTSTGGTYVAAGKWTSVSSKTQFYLPTWVDEGQYTILFRSTAINSDANNGENKTETLANTELVNYVATDTIDVEVSGRIYGLNLYDISDYPIWEDVFRIPHSLSLTDFKYTVGDKDENGNSNGNNVKYTLALVNGSHPQYINIGAVKTGYVTRFELQTIGNMYDDNDYVRIMPAFSYVDSKGQTRQEVDIYYSETFNNKKQVMVKMGSTLDMENKKSLRTGDPYLSIPENELIATAAIKGLSIKKLKAQIRNVFTYTNIMIPENLRTFAGNITDLPAGVTQVKAAQSVQNWYGEYYLPSEVHVVPKGYNVMEYIKNNGGINYEESFWLRNGYIIVNFRIETVQNGERHLSYINSDNAARGYCNMWKREGYQYQKADYDGNIFHFEDGDYVLYYTGKSVSKDYISAGTH